MMASTEHVTVTVTDGDPVDVSVEGQIDSHTVTSIDDALAGVDAEQAVTIDLSGVSFIDSSGLRVLVRADKRQSGGGGSLTIANPSEPVARLLQITGLDATLTVVT